MTVPTLRSMDHAVGIHVSRPPQTLISQSNGRVKPRVHLRIRVNEVNSGHSEVNSGHSEVNSSQFFMFWHCLALFGTVWLFLPKATIDSEVNLRVNLRVI